jgi:hypothetical protein
MDIHTLLKSHDNAKALLTVGPSFGLQFWKAGPAGSNNVINLGAIPNQSLETVLLEVPHGYEDEEELFLRLAEPLTLSFQPTEKFKGSATATIRSLDIFPKNNAFLPTMTIECEGDSGDLKLPIGGEITFQMEIRMTPEFCGQLKRLLVLRIEVEERTSLLITQKIELIVGALIIGSVLPKGIDKAVQLKETGPNALTTDTAALSVDARPFAPIAAISMFDIPVSHLEPCN